MSLSRLALTWTTLSNMCAKGRNEMLTSCVVGTTAVCGTQRLMSATRLTYTLQIFPIRRFKMKWLLPQSIWWRLLRQRPRSHGSTSLPLGFLRKIRTHEGQHFISSKTLESKQVILYKKKNTLTWMFKYKTNFTLDDNSVHYLKMGWVGESFQRHFVPRTSIKLNAPSQKTKSGVCGYPGM